MDFIKKAADKALNKDKDHKEEGQQQNQGGDNQQQQGGDNNQQQQSSGAGERDYLDKGLGFASKKAGYNLDRDTEEKIGDGMRDQYEKYSGSKVPEKFSN